MSQTEALAGLTEAFYGAAADRDALLRLVVDRVAALTGGGCLVRLFTEAGAALGAATFWHPDPRIEQMMREVNGLLPRERRAALFEAVLDRRDTVQLSISPETPGLSDESRAFLRAHPGRRNLASPLVARDRVIGVIVLVWLHTDTPVSPADERLFLEMARRAALAIDNATQLVDARATADRLRVVTDVAREFTAATPETEILLDLVARKLWEHIGDFCSVRPVDERGEAFLPTAYTWHADPKVIATVGALRAYAPIQSAQTAMRTGRPAILPELAPGALADGAPEPTRSLLLALDVRSLAVLPLVVNQRVFAVATLFRSGDRKAYTEDDIRLAQDIAVHATLALTNSCLLREVQASERRFARLAESGLLGVLTIAPDDRILEANDTFLRMVGYSHEEIAAFPHGWRDLTPPEWDDVSTIVLGQVRESGVSRPIEKEFIRKDGSWVPVLLGVARLEDGNRIAFIADLTDRRRAELALRKSEEQLRHAQKMEAVGRLAGGIAHDFNNMLSVILSLADLLLEDLGPNDPMREDLDEIHKAGQRASELTRQLLLFSRQQVVEARVVDLSTVLQGMRRLLERLLGEDVALHVQPGPGGALVFADPSQIEQVVMNLVVNARDAMPTGGQLSIEVGEVVLDEGYAHDHPGARVGPHVMIAVSDTGVGMDRDTQARIFEPFFTTKPVGRGTGLGLSTVFGIVQHAGGTVWVYSEPGKGSTFKVYLPRAADLRTEVVAPPGVSELRGRETILLVEDEDQVRLVARAILRRLGYTVVEARNAGEALLLCERRGHPIDLMLSDVVMPEMSGPELARRLASTRPDMRVLCMSGYTDDAVVRHGLIDNGFAFLQKPITPERLARKVREVLDAPWPRTG